MQGRAAAVYGLVLLLVAAGAGAYVATAEPPEPTLQDPDLQLTAQQGETVSITGPDGSERVYRVDGFTTQRGQPAATLVWTDEDARSTAQWTHAAEPSGTTVTVDNESYFVRIPQVPSPTNATLLEEPDDNASVSIFTDDGGSWVVNASGQYVPLAEYQGLERTRIQVDDDFEAQVAEESRTVRVESITNESVTVNFTQPAETEVFVRQTSRATLNGVNATAHFTENATGVQLLQLTTDEAEIDRYLAAHDDRVQFQHRLDGLIATVVLALVAAGLLVALSTLPRKE